MTVTLATAGTYTDENRPRLWMKPEPVDNWKIYELAAAFDGVLDVDVLELEDEESLVDDVLVSVLVDESLLDSPALSLTELDPPRLSVR